MSAPEDDDEAGAAGATILSGIQTTTRPPRDLWTDEQTEVLKQVLMEAAGKKNWFQITHAYNQKALEKGWTQRPKKGCQCRFRLMQRNGIISEDEDEDVDSDYGEAGSSMYDESPPASGLEWKNVGSVQPATGKELFHEGLSEALQKKIKFEKDEWYNFEHDLFPIGEELKMNHYIKSGTDYFQPTTPWSIWEHHFMAPLLLKTWT